MGNAGIKASQAGTSMRSIMTNLTGDVKLSGAAIGDVTIATTNADGSMRSLSAILADCRGAFAGMTEAEKANNAEALVGKNAMSGFLALMNAAIRMHGPREGRKVPFLLSLKVLYGYRR